MGGLGTGAERVGDLGPRRAGGQRPGDGQLAFGAEGVELLGSVSMRRSGLTVIVTT
jgi:hypothetical protein